MLERIIDDYITEKRAVDLRPSDKFRVSDAGRCRLMRYWKRQGKPASDEPDARAQRVFEVGHVFHAWLQDLLEEKGLLVGKEISVEDEHRSGHIDALVRTDEGLVLYDFKTVHSRKFYYKRREGNNGDLHYHMQAYTYACMLPPTTGNIKDIRIAYISKDDLLIEEVSVVIDDVRYMVADDWSQLIKAWTEGKEPEPNPAQWECRYCVYKSSCQYALGGMMKSPQKERV